MNPSNRSVRLLLAAVAFAMLPNAARAAEVWTYYFTPDASRPFYQDCYGDCTVSGTRADLAGTFSILLDWQTGTGQLFTIEDRLVNVATVRSSPSGPVITPSIPSFWQNGVAATSPYFLEGKFTYSGGVGHLVSDGTLAGATDVYRAGVPYEVTFGLTSAKLTLSTVPVFGQRTIVTAAPAVLVSAGTAGDFNGDNRVDARDYIAWRNSNGSQSGYTLWRTYLGFGLPATGAASAAFVPEPPALSLALALITMPPLLSRRRGLTVGDRHVKAA